MFVYILIYICYIFRYFTIVLFSLERCNEIQMYFNIFCICTSNLLIAIKFCDIFVFNYVGYKNTCIQLQLLYIHNVQINLIILSLCSLFTNLYSQIINFYTGCFTNKFQHTGMGVLD